jgi:TonB family protein
MRGPTTITKGGGSATTPSAEVEEWKQALVTRIDANKRYPPEALRRGEGGVTQVYFEIDREGRVTSSRIIRSSGSAILDQEALDLLQRVSPLPAPPAALPGPTARLTLPVRFNYASPLTIEGSAPTPPAEVTDWMAVAEWKKVAVASIRRNTRYPPGARGEGGTARVYFEIDQDGKVTSSRIVSSSGSVFFDREALDMLRRASPLPAPPASLGPTVKLTLPIRFNAAAAPRSSEPAEGKGKR